MKLHTIVLLFGAAVASGAKLVARQSTCSEDNCFRAVWGTARGPDHPLTALLDCMSRLTTTVATYPITTVTFVARTTATAVMSCSTILTSSTTSSPSSSAPSLPGFSFPTPTPTPAEIAAGKVEARQNEVLSYSTTTIIGSIPTYAGDNCFNSGSVYASVCSCKNVTTDILSKISTTLTSTDTLTLTSTVTSTASCSSSTIITLSHSSSTMVTTVTLTSSTGTGAGTVSSSTFSSSSSTSFNTTTTPSSTLNSSSTTVNTSSTTSTTPTPSCVTSGWILCNSTCLNPANDESNCGSCGNQCGDGLVCFNGVCARRPVDPPCDSNCTFQRLCNQGVPDGPAGGCKCARDSSGFGVCFDANRYQCTFSAPRCKQTTESNDPLRPGCKLGEICVKSICAGSSSCGNTTVPEADQDGICVTTEGCGRQGPTSLGALVKVGEQEQRKRLVGEFIW